MAVDNSVYQFMPQAVVYPKDAHDLQLMLRLARRPRMAKEFRRHSSRTSSTNNNSSRSPRSLVNGSQRERGRLLRLTRCKLLLRQMRSRRELK